MASTAKPEILTPYAEISAAELGTLLHSAGFSPLLQTGWIRVTGEDRGRWLNGMVTNSVQHLAPGEGAYSFFLNAQGRIQGDGTVFQLAAADSEEKDALWIETARDQVGGLLTMLDRFIIMDDVELGDVSGEWAGLLIAGPQAASVLSKVGIDMARAKPPAVRNAVWNTAQIRVVHAYSPLVPRFEIWIRDNADTALSSISEALQQAGAMPCQAASLQPLRMLEGVPLYGADIRDRELPQETGQLRALHFAKGCYLGQEIVERIRSRGSVHRTFRGFRLEGELPPAGAMLEADGKPVGELTSVAAIPLSASSQTPAPVVQLALGYVRREAVERGLPLTYPGGIAIPVSLPVSLPSTPVAALLQSPASELSERV